MTKRPALAVLTALIGAGLVSPVAGGELPQAPSRNESDTSRLRPVAYAGSYRLAALDASSGALVGPASPEPVPAAQSTVPVPRLKAREEKVKRALKSYYNALPARIEVRGGYDLTTTAANLGEEEVDIEAEGMIYGVSTGYDRAFGRMFVGAFASVDWSEAEVSGASYSDPDPITGAVTEYRLTQSYDRDIEVGARIGVTLSRFIRLYALGAFTNVKRDFRTVDTTVTPVVDGEPTIEIDRGQTISEYDDGWRVGVGTEIELRKRFYLSGEVRFTDYGQDSAFPEDEVVRLQGLVGLGLRL